MYFRQSGGLESEAPATNLLPMAQPRGDVRSSAQAPTQVQEVIKPLQGKRRELLPLDTDPLLEVRASERLPRPTRTASHGHHDPPPPSHRKEDLESSNESSGVGNHSPIWSTQEIGKIPDSIPPKTRPLLTDLSVYPDTQQSQSDGAPSEPSFQGNVHSPRDMSLVSAAFSRQTHPITEPLPASTTIGASKAFSHFKQ